MNPAQLVVLTGRNGMNNRTMAPLYDHRGELLGQIPIDTIVSEGFKIVGGIFGGIKRRQDRKRQQAADHAKEVAEKMRLADEKIKADARNKKMIIIGGGAAAVLAIFMLKKKG